MGGYQQFDEQDIAQDYLQLLQRGSVVRRLAISEHSAWRSAIRAKARTDELKLRTWSRDGRPATVWAVLPDWRLTPEGRERLAERLAWQRED
jgi:phosphatidylserine/phosphatidylglycerophosphate/cardiolipin synthase-like enzyme